MRVFVAGATGAIGKQLVPRLVEAGHEVHGMTRSESKQAMLHGLGASFGEAVRRRAAGARDRGRLLGSVRGLGHSSRIQESAWRWLSDLRRRADGMTVGRPGWLEKSSGRSAKQNRTATQLTLV